MSYNKAGSSLQHLLNCLLNYLFSFCVYRGGSLIQNKDPRICQNCSRQRNQLFLSRGKPITAFPYFSIISRFQSDDKIMAIYKLCRPYYILVRGIEAPVLYIFLNCSA